MSHSEDEDIARAIALSLQDAAKTQPEVIDLVSSDDDEAFKADVQRAIEASEAGNTQTMKEKPARPEPSISNAQAGPSSSSSSVTPLSSFLAERAQLERERRERQKRLRPDIVVDSAKGHGDLSDDEESEEDGVPAKRQRISSPSESRADQARAKSSSSVSHSTRMGQSTRARHAAGDAPTIDRMFWDGELRQTATQHAEPRKDGRPTIRLTEILGKRSELSFAIMSSYSLDFAWIYQFFDPSVPVIMVAQPDESGQASLKYVLPNWIKTTPMLRGGRGCQHMKFMLLFYKTGRLRVVVSTANLIAYDWRDMENSVWLQDIPLRSKPIAHDPKATDDFPAVLQRVLYSLNVRAALTRIVADDRPDLAIKSIDELRMRWDFSMVKAYLVPSVAGRHEGWPSVLRTGHTRLMKVVRDMDLRTGTGKGAKVLTLECQGSSIGTYTTQWINEFFWSARGESAEDWLDRPKKRRETLPYPSVKIIFPTKTTVQQSTLGEQGGGTIFCRRKQWAAKNFPRDHFYDSRSKGGPVLMHSKMIIATYGAQRASEKRGQDQGSTTEDETDEDIRLIESAIGWAYVGSHNFTPSAWGNLSGSGFNPILNISNYELGVVFPLRDAEQLENVACWERPPRRYVIGEDDPWMQEESIYHQDA